MTLLAAVPAPEITDLKLAAAAVLVLGAGGISVLAGLGLLKSLLVGVARTVIQLLLMGFALGIIFQWNRPYAVAGVVLLMCLVATFEALQRSKGVFRPPRSTVFWTMAATTYTVSLIICAAVIRPEPIWKPQVALPLAGMVLGHTLNVVSLALERLHSEMSNRLEQVEVLLTLGATPWEAARGPCRGAIRAGMTPILNALNIVGLVSLPGVMTGQILAGADPVQAARYQIVIMLMLALAASLSSLLTVVLGYRRYFTAEDGLDPDLRKTL